MRTKAAQKTSPKRKRWPLALLICFPIYVLSTGPVAWATNDALHPAYLPEQLEAIYLPLAPLTKLKPLGDALYWWRAIVWQGFPAGYTTL
jgi:hypothetical protein